jgi:uncharacterized membrane protein
MMTPLTKEYVEQCPLEDGFRCRGMEMTRIEVFVDAAFAFALTMLVISFDHIPETWGQIVEALKGIPAFVFAVVQLVWIWYVHNKWSKRYGLENATTVALSAALLIVVLIYIYPLRIMAEGMFRWLSNGYLPSNFRIETIDELAGLFVFMGIGFFCLSMVFVLMYRYARSLQSQLRLSAYEIHETRTLEILWMVIASTGLVTAVTAMTFPDPLVPFSGFTFALIGGWIPWIRVKRHKNMKSQGIEPHEAEPA